MDNEKETRKKLLSSAMKEFYEKGYTKASLRNICKEAGVTTGALYFFFEDKDDLFGSLVDEPLKRLEEMIGEHFSAELDISKGLDVSKLTPANIASKMGLQDDMEIANGIIRFIFANKTAFDLLLTRAQGSRYESIPDHMVELVEAHYSKLYVVMKGYQSKREMTKEDKFIVHWISHDQIDIFIHIVTHCKDVKDAEKQMKNMIAYMIGGWLAVINT